MEVFTKFIYKKKLHETLKIHTNIVGAYLHIENSETHHSHTFYCEV
jgi:hypothetical protein